MNSFFLSELHKKDISIVPKFNSQWISNWLQSHRISLRKYHFQQRKVNDPEESLIYGEERFSAILRYGAERVFNMDENSWDLIPHDEKVWAVTRSDEAIFDISQNYLSKSRFTCNVMINAYGQKLPLITVAKGKTVRCESSFRKVLGNIVTHTPNGWSTECLMLAYIQWISQVPTIISSA